MYILHGQDIHLQASLAESPADCFRHAGGGAETAGIGDQDLVCHCYLLDAFGCRKLYLQAEDTEKNKAGAGVPRLPWVKGALLFGFDGNRARLDRFRLGQADGQHAVFEIGFGFVGLHVGGE